MKKTAILFIMMLGFIAGCAIIVPRHSGPPEHAKAYGYRDKHKHDNGKHKGNGNDNHQGDNNQGNDR